MEWVHITNVKITYYLNCKVCENFWVPRTTEKKGCSKCGSAEVEETLMPNCVYLIKRGSDRGKCKYKDFATEFLGMKPERVDEEKKDCRIARPMYEGTCPVLDKRREWDELIKRYLKRALS